MTDTIDDMVCKRHVIYDGEKYDIEGIAKLVIFIIRIPNNANPRRTSIDIIRSFITLKLPIIFITKNPTNVGFFVGLYDNCIISYG